MNVWTSESASLIGLLFNQGRLQKVLNYRKAVGHEKLKRWHMMLISIGMDAWNKLLLDYAGFADSQLQANLSQLQNELDLRLGRIYQIY